MTKVIHSLLLSILLQSTATMAQDSYTFMVDKGFSSPVGAENLLSVHQLTYTLENGLLKTSWWDETGVVGKSLGISYRLGKTVLVDNIIDEFTVLVQHEVYGHGARAREYELSNIKYSLTPFPPYGRGDGSTAFNYADDQPSSIDGDLSMTIAGVESNSILSRRLAFRWLQRGKINYRETILYTMSSNDLTEYLWQTKLSKTHVEGNDMLAYEMQVNQREGFLDPSEYKLRVNDLAKQALIIGLDPFQYFSLYALFKSYLYSGEESFEFPMIELGRFKYLPSFRMGLTPFGSEIFLDNLLVRSDKVVDVYFRYGIPTFHRFWGLGFYGMNLFKATRFSFDAGVDLWNQPAININGIDIWEMRSSLGGAISCRVLAKLVESFAAISVVGEMKAKTTGYLPGEPLRDALVLRAGLNFKAK
jgi:hypothetical protein